MNSAVKPEPATAASESFLEDGGLVWAEGHLIRQLRMPAALALVVVAGVLSGLLLLWLTRRYDFFYDEWSYVLYVRNFSIGQYFVPHNEHWTTIPAVTYRVLLLIFGARSYLPYMAVLTAWNLLTAFFLFLLVRRRCGEVPALAAAVMFLVLGRGWENMIWADQLAFAGAAALGLLAVLLLTGPEISASRGWIGAAALMAALMTSGPALFFLCWLIVELALSKAARPRLIYLIPPVAGYLIWFAIIGRTTITSHQSPLALSTLMALPGFVATGVGAAAAGLVGLGVSWAPVGAIVLIAIVGIGWARHRPAPAVIGAAAGLVSEFVIIGLVRSRYGDADAAGSRHVGIAAIFLLVVLADIVRGIRWRSPVAAAGLAVVLIGILLNGLYLHEAASARYLDSVLPGEVSEQVAWAYHDSPGLNRNQSVDPVWLPASVVGSTVGAYIAARRAQGSPLPSLAPSQLTRYPAPLVNRALTDLFPPRIDATAASPQQACTQEPAGGVAVPAGAALTFRSAQAGPVAVQVWHYGPMPGYAVAQAASTGTGRALTVRTGEPDAGFMWSVRVTGPPSSPVSVCGPP